MCIYIYIHHTDSHHGMDDLFHHQSHVASLRQIFCKALLQSWDVLQMNSLYVWTLRDDLGIVGQQSVSTKGDFLNGLLPDWLGAPPVQLWQKTKTAFIDSYMYIYIYVILYLSVPFTFVFQQNEREMNILILPFSPSMFLSFCSG